MSEFGWGQGAAMSVHRTDEGGKALCGVNTVTEGNRESAMDLVSNHGYTLCTWCSIAAFERSATVAGNET